MSSSNDALSQKEIDKLMNEQAGEESDNNEQLLTEEEIDIIGEVNNIAMGAGATVLYTLMDEEVKITTPRVEVKSFQDITDEYERPCVLVKVEYISGLEGINLLIINLEDAAVIADLMMGGDGRDIGRDDKLDEIHLSAVGEAMNQMMGSSSTSISNIIDETVNISPPEVQYLSLDDAVNNEEEFFAGDELLVATSFDLKIADLVDSSFKQLAPLEFTKQLTTNLQNSASGLTAKSDNSHQSQISAVTEEKLSSREDKYNKNAESRPEDNIERESRNSYDNQKFAEKEVGVREAQFPEFDKRQSGQLPQNMELLKDVPLEVTVRLGKTRMTINEILELGEGSIVELDKLAGEPVDLYVNGKLIAKGEVVVIDENFGFRVKDIINPVDRITKNL